jgi:hypothetical protein
MPKIASISKALFWSSVSMLYWQLFARTSFIFFEHIAATSFCIPWRVMAGSCHEALLVW